MTAAGPPGPAASEIGSRPSGRLLFFASGSPVGPVPGGGRRRPGLRPRRWPRWSSRGGWARPDGAADTGLEQAEPAPAAEARRAGGSPGRLAHAGDEATAGGPRSRETVRRGCGGRSGGVMAAIAPWSACARCRRPLRRRASRTRKPLAAIASVTGQPTPAPTGCARGPDEGPGQAGATGRGRVALRRSLAPRDRQPARGAPPSIASAAGAGPIELGPVRGAIQPGAPSPRGPAMRRRGRPAPGGTHPGGRGHRGRTSGGAGSC